ncbi:MAG: DUF305 domain-containing protein [Gammaproteobacteria bacterium]
MRILAGAGVAILLGAAAAQAAVVQPGAPGQPNKTLTPEQLADLARLRVDPADVKFMQDMIHHHAQAVEMVALLNDRTQRQDMKLLGQRISISQNDEIKMMKAWLARRGQPEMAPRGPGMPGMNHSMPGMNHSMPGMDHGMPAASKDRAPGVDIDTPMMPGMLTPRQMQTLAAAKGPTFDRLFLTGMIQHHEGALSMVHDLMAQPGAGEDSDLFEFTSGVLDDQSAEIQRMQGLLAGLSQSASHGQAAAAGRDHVAR